MRPAENYAGNPLPNGVYEWPPLLEKIGQMIILEYYGFHPHGTELTNP